MLSNGAIHKECGARPAVGNITGCCCITVPEAIDVICIYLALESDGQEKTISAKDNSIAPDEVLLSPLSTPYCTD